MTDLLVYWRDYRENLARRLAGEPVAYWHSNSRLLGRLAAGDRLWMVTCGAAARAEPKEAAFLVAIWNVVEAAENPGDDPDYPPTQYRHRVVADSEESVWFCEPVPVDHILRPEKWNKSMPIGRLLQGPRKISGEKLRLLRAAAGADLAIRWLVGKKG